jgi:apolipoprotein N-acyltransferase
MKSSFRLLALGIGSGLLLAFSWPEIGWSYLIFFAWIPLLLIAEHFLGSTNGKSALYVLLLSYISFIIWNVGATWWIVNASFEGAILAFLANSLLMAGVFTLVFLIRKRLRWQHSAWLLLPFWLGAEYLHHDWDLSWPWLTMGNVFANNIQLIQWYEFTGTGGGSLWILAVNLLILELYRKFTKGEELRKSIRNIALTLLLPAAISLIIFSSYEEKGKTIKIAVVQPNIDPYNEKFDPETIDQQLDKFLSLSETICDSNTSWLLGPETALIRPIEEAEFAQSGRVKRLQAFQQRFPGLNILMGAETYSFFNEGDHLPGAVRKTPDGNHYYEMYNTAFHLNSKISFYHKSKLVPGVEQMPFPQIFNLVEDWAINLGGTTGSLGKQDERTVFTSTDQQSVAAPAICYESVYGDFMTNYIRKGANFIAIITNDGWWGNTPGHRQHLAYASLRAIETRRDVVRAANTGISCFINQKGEIRKALPYWTDGCISDQIHLNPEFTIFSQTGDLIGKASVIFALLTWLWFFSRRFVKKKLA